MATTARPARRVHVVLTAWLVHLVQLVPMVQ
jgi:hypothetical protein